MDLVYLRDFYGTVVVPNNVFGHHYDDDPGSGCSDYAFGSLKCRCQQEMIDCVPVDGYETILVCDNTDGIVDTGRQFKSKCQKKVYSASSLEMGICRQNCRQ